MTEPDIHTSRRAHAVVRSLILAVSTLAIVVVLFAVYQYSTGVGESGEVVITGGPEPADQSPLVELEDHQTPGLPAGAARLGRGKKIKLIQYEPNTTRARFELEVADYRPTGDSRGDVQQIELVEPVIRLATRDGQRVRVQAAGGFLDVKKRGEGAFEPRSGELIGRVDIQIDRLSRKERDRLGPQERDAPPDAARLIELTFDGISFDLDASSVETQGPFSVRMAEAQIDGVGLRVRYNDVDNRVEHFEIMHGGSAVVFGLGDLFDAMAPNGSEAAGEGQGPRTTVDEPAGARPVLPHDAAEAVQTYLAEIDQAVTIRLLDGEEVSQRLTADRLNVLFDFSRSQRQAIRSGSSPVFAPTGSQDRDSEAVGAQPDRGTRLVLEWSGGFVVRPGAIGDRGAFPGSRLRIVALGDEVRFTSRQGEAVCGMLEFHRETGRMWLTGGADGWVVLSRDQARLVAGDVFIDRSMGLVRIDGPARLSGVAELPTAPSSLDAGQSGLSELDIRFEDSAELSIATHTSQRVDPLGDTVETVRTEYISSARFTGDAMLKRGADVLAGDTVAMTFDPPAAESVISEQIRELDAGGQVLLVRGQDRLTCAELNVTFAPDPTGRPLPRRARAGGDVVFSSGELMVTAGGTIALEMVPVLKPKREFDLWEASFDAMARGVDPTQVDWAKVRTKHDARIEYETGLQRLDAWGGVTAYDPTRGLDVSAASLEAKFVNGREVEQVRVTGREGTDAFVQLGDISIASHVIAANLQTQRVDVFGPGTLGLASYRGLDGNRTDDPQEIEVSWTREMTFRGQDHTARFLGQVHALSRRRIRPVRQHLAKTGSSGDPTMLETATFDCDELAIDFVDVEPEPTRESVLDARWWIFAPLAERWSRQEESAGPKLNQEPAYVVASRQVVGVFKTVDAVTGRVRNRIRLAADKLTADLQAELLTVPVAGTLLIEDYKVPSLTSGSEDRGDALFNRGRSDVPSQTYASWSGLMSFDAGRYRADFRGDVVLDYRSGDEMLLADAILAQGSFVPGRLTGGGRHTRLECGELMVEFARRSDSGPASGGGVAAMSVREIRQLEALGGVFLEDEEFTVTAERVVKYEQSDLLRIFGREDEEAEVYSRRAHGPRFRGMEFNYHLITGRIDAPDLQVRGRR
ncbi:MAG: hypothetical protein V3W34_02720 [Phycisphaerae bacterium]